MKPLIYQHQLQLQPKELFLWVYTYASDTVYNKGKELVEKSMEVSEKVAVVQNTLLLHSSLKT